MKSHHMTCGHMTSIRHNQRYVQCTDSVVLISLRALSFEGYTGFTLSTFIFGLQKGKFVLFTSKYGCGIYKFVLCYKTIDTV